MDVNDEMVLKDLSYNFILPESPQYDLAKLKMSTPEDVTELCVPGEFIWAFLSYYYLAQHGARVSLSFELDCNAINLAHGNVLRSLKMRPDCFCVSLQADYPCFPMAHYHIVQNREQESKRASYIPHWPLAGQQPRSHGRTGVKRVAYQGAKQFTELDECRLNSDLKPYGIAFHSIDTGNWRYLQDVDVLVGVRSFSRKKYRRKPPTKLINAWHAGIPFIGGWDAAYTQVGAPGRDYVRVASYDELLQAIIRLQEDPLFYHELVDAGRQRAKDYTFEAIAQAWLDLLTNELKEAYRQWERQPAKKLRFAFRKLCFLMHTRIRSGLRLLYVVPGIRNMRESYYDPAR